MPPFHRRITATQLTTAEIGLSGWHVAASSRRWPVQFSCVFKSIRNAILNSDVNVILIVSIDENEQRKVPLSSSPTRTSIKQVMINLPCGVFPFTISINNKVLKQHIVTVVPLPPLASPLEVTKQLGRIGAPSSHASTALQTKYGDNPIVQFNFRDLVAASVTTVFAQFAKDSVPAVPLEKKSNDDGSASWKAETQIPHGIYFFRWRVVIDSLLPRSNTLPLSTAGWDITECKRSSLVTRWIQLQVQRECEEEVKQITNTSNCAKTSIEKENFQSTNVDADHQLSSCDLKLFLDERKDGARDESRTEKDGSRKAQSRSSTSSESSEILTIQPNMEHDEACGANQSRESLNSSESADKVVIYERQSSNSTQSLTTEKSDEMRNTEDAGRDRTILEPDCTDSTSDSEQVFDPREIVNTHETNLSHQIIESYFTVEDETTGSNNTYREREEITSTYRNQSIQAHNGNSQHESLAILPVSNIMQRSSSALSIQTNNDLGIIPQAAMRIQNITDHPNLLPRTNRSRYTETGDGTSRNSGQSSRNSANVNVDVSININITINTTDTQRRQTDESTEQSRSTSHVTVLPLPQSHANNELLGLPYPPTLQSLPSIGQIPLLELSSVEQPSVSTSTNLGSPAQPDPIPVPYNLNNSANSSNPSQQDRNGDSFRKDDMEGLQSSRDNCPLSSSTDGITPCSSYDLTDEYTTWRRSMHRHRKSQRSSQGNLFRRRNRSGRTSPIRDCIRGRPTRSSSRRKKTVKREGISSETEGEPEASPSQFNNNNNERISTIRNPLSGLSEPSHSTRVWPREMYESKTVPSLAVALGNDEEVDPWKPDENNRNSVGRGPRPIGRFPLTVFPLSTVSETATQQSSSGTRIRMQNSVMGRLWEEGRILGRLRQLTQQSRIGGFFTNLNGTEDEVGRG